MDSKLAQTLQRVLATNFQVQPTRYKSHKILLIEYFRRSALWAKQLECTNEWPIFDIALHINSSIRADDAVIDVVEKHLRSGVKVSFEMESLIINALHWAALQDGVLTLDFNLAEPYEPIILMYERGGFFFRSHEGIEITYVTTISRMGWEHYCRDIPYDSIEISQLDRADVSE